jgi:histidine triad (HIT) family protein
MNSPSNGLDGCPFCGMVRGEVEAHRVYAGESVFAIMDRRPINPYHLLVIPVVHEPDFYDLDEATYGHLMGVARRLAVVVKALAAPKKVGLVIAGFDVAHTHVHIIPLHNYHDVTSKRLLEATVTRPSPAELAAQAAHITDALRQGDSAREVRR